MRYRFDIEDESGDIVELLYFCSASCFEEHAVTPNSAEGHYVPCPEMADYRQYCATCGECVIAAMDEPSFDSWPSNKNGECEGHPAGEFDPMGQTMYCDGSCKVRKYPADAILDNSMRLHGGGI